VAAGRYGENVRVLLSEVGTVVDLVFEDQVEIILGVVLRNLLQGEILGCRYSVGHGGLRYLNDIAVRFL
jgi:hypothetical protein